MTQNDSRQLLTRWRRTQSAFLPLIVSCWMGCWTCCSCCTAALAQQRPNIVVIVADDLGWADVSVHGDQIRTPHIDRLAVEGAELSRFYVCPVCSPTRAGLMTGRYPIRFGLMRAVVPPWRQGGLSTDETTLPEVLARAGYQHRGIFGKWHLGHSDVKFHPLRRGFTEFVGHYNGAIDYFTHYREGERDWHHGYEPSGEPGYSTDLIAGAACRFIDRHAGSAEPFFCYVPFNAPHGPFQAKADELEAYRNLADVGPRFGSGRRQDGYGAQGRGRSRRQTLAAMISSLDQGVGRILDTLRQNNVEDNTLVWFFSDNGGVPPGDNRPLNGRKGTVFEGGVRVVAAARWPGQIPAGSKIDTPLAYIDVLPTLASIAGLDSHGGKPLDGVDVTDILTARKTELPRDLYCYIGQGGEQNEQLALIEPTWKLIVQGPRITDESVAPARRKTLLYCIGSDPYEKDNVADEHPEVVRRMRDKLTRFRSLQPADGVPPYNSRKDPFVPQSQWRIPGATTDSEARQDR